MSDIRIGDLVQNIEDPALYGVGLVVDTDVEMWGMPQEPSGVKVVWPRPYYFDPKDGASVMYQDELKVISASRR